MADCFGLLHILLSSTGPEILGIVAYKLCLALILWACFHHYLICVIHLVNRVLKQDVQRKTDNSRCNSFFMIPLCFKTCADVLTERKMTGM